MKICGSCGKRHVDSDKFCGECGSRLSEPANYCPECEETFINTNNKFCTQCGTKLVIKSNSENKIISKTYIDKTPTKSTNNSKKEKAVVFKKNKNPAPPDNFIKNLISDSIIKPKINPKDNVVMVEDNPYRKYDDKELITMLKDAEKDQERLYSEDIYAAAVQFVKIQQIQEELENRRIHY